MKKIKVFIKADSPLVITLGATTGMNHETLHYIPGAMLLGTFANLWRNNFFEANGFADADPRFQNLFLNGKVQWGNALPEDSKSNISVPIPLCFMKLKGHGGLAKEGKNSEAFVYNNLAISAEGDFDFNLLKKKYEEKFKAQFEQNNKHTPKPKKLSLGFMTNELEPHQVDVKENWSVHVALDTKRSAVDEKLFGYSSIVAGSRFVSEIYYEDCAKKDLLDLLKKCQFSAIHVGSSKSAGYGFASYSIDDKEESVLTTPTTLRKKDGATVISAHLISDYVARRSFETFKESIEKEFKEKLQVEKVELITDETFSSNGINSGFNGVWKLSRTARETLTLGSVITLKITGPFDSKDLPETIGGLKQEGLGRLIYDPCYLVKQSGSSLDPYVYVKNEDDVKTEELKKPAPKNQELISANEDSPMIKMLRQRAILRLVKENSQKIIYSEVFENFLADLKKKCKKEPSANQRGNLRVLFTYKNENYWLDEFFDKLGKTPGKQWLNTYARSPIEGVANIRIKNTSTSHQISVNTAENLSDIMTCLMDKNCFKNMYDNIIKKNIINKLTLVGGLPPTEDEKRLYLKLLHKATLLELLNAWDKAVRTDTKEEK